MSADGKNKKGFDYKPIAVYIIMIGLGFFSAKAGFGLLSKRSSVKKFPAKNTASVLSNEAIVPEKVAVKSVVVKPIIPSVALTQENIAFKREEKKKTISVSEVTAPVIYASEEESAKFVLNGIAFSDEPGQISFALINNKVVKIGEKVAGAEVTKISKNSVELKTIDSKIVTLSQKK